MRRPAFVLYALVLTAAGVANVWINYVAKGRHCDLYPFAEFVWVVMSALVPCWRGATKRLVPTIVALLFVDAFVDLCAMGKQTWWASAPLLVEWKWGVDPHKHLLYAYWAFTWGIQVPARCIVLALANTGRWGTRFVLVALGLNIIWITAPQDVIYYFVWLGLYDAHVHYFHYLPPEGTWNLWNMLLLRVPIGVGLGALLIRVARSRPSREQFRSP